MKSFQPISEDEYTQMSAEFFQKLIDVFGGFPSNMRIIIGANENKDFLAFLVSKNLARINKDGIELNNNPLIRAARRSYCLNEHRICWEKIGYVA